MNASIASPAAPRAPFPVWPVTLALVPFLCLLWAYWPALAELARTWQNNPQYSHGYLVPIFAIALLWLRRNRIDAPAFKPNFLIGLPLLAIGIGLKLRAGYYYYVTLDPISLLPCVAGLCFLLGGMAAWRWAWPSVLFLVFMMQLPYSIDTAMSGPLQRLATTVSTFLMQMIGLPALAEGNTILLNDHQIGIVEACSGLRMLVVFFALSTAVVLVIDRPWLDRLVILASAIPIALISNILRITLTGILFETTSNEIANAFFHDAAGWIMMPLALGLLWVELKVLSLLLVETPESLAARLTPRSVRTQHRSAPPRSPRQPVQAKPARERQSRRSSPRPAAEPS